MPNDRPLTSVSHRLLLYLDGFRFFGAMLVVLKVWTSVSDDFNILLTSE